MSTVALVHWGVPQERRVAEGNALPQENTFWYTPLRLQAGRNRGGMLYSRRYAPAWAGAHLTRLLTCRGVPRAARCRAGARKAEA